MAATVLVSSLSSKWLSFNHMHTRLYFHLKVPWIISSASSNISVYVTHNCMKIFVHFPHKKNKLKLTPTTTFCVSFKIAIQQPLANSHGPARPVGRDHGLTESEGLKLVTCCAQSTMGCLHVLVTGCLHSNACSFAMRVQDRWKHI